MHGQTIGQNLQRQMVVSPGGLIWTASRPQSSMVDVVRRRRASEDILPATRAVGTPFPAAIACGVFDQVSKVCSVLSIVVMLPVSSLIACMACWAATRWITSSTPAVSQGVAAGRWFGEEASQAGVSLEDTGSCPWC